MRGDDPEMEEDEPEAAELEAERRSEDAAGRSPRTRTPLRAAPRRRRNWTWVAVLLLLASIYVFWVLPYQLGSRPVQVEFVQEKP